MTAAVTLAVGQNKCSVIPLILSSFSLIHSFSNSLTTSSVNVNDSVNGAVTVSEAIRVVGLDFFLNWMRFGC